MEFLSLNDNVIKCNSEGVIISYLSPIDNKEHKYYVDFLVKMRDGRVFLIEIKPYYQTIPPKKGKNERTYQKALETYMVNLAKWESAKKYADSKGWIFKILTEKELFNKK